MEDGVAEEEDAFLEEELCKRREVDICAVKEVAGRSLTAATARIITIPAFMGEYFLDARRICASFSGSGPTN